MKKTRFGIVAAITGALLLSPALTGCISIEGIIEQATDGQVNLSIGSMPDGWPAEVPVVPGDIVGGGVVAGDDGNSVWNVTINATSGDSFESIAAQLTGAGFEKVENPTEDSVQGVNGGFFTGDTYSVVVAISDGDDATVVNYTVTKIDAES